MNCPKCKDIILKFKISNFPYSCPKCGGLWLESDSLGKLQELSDYTSGGHSTPEHDSRTGLCPQGHGILTRAKVEAEHSFFLEKCSKCNGIWFDKGEWQKVSESHIHKNLRNLWSFVWQQKQKSEKKKQQMISINKQALGDELYKAIMELADKLREHPEKHRALILLDEAIDKKPLTNQSS